tara:strand:- start:1146 stop:2288 length:1143 start_codon:yes stop_codon:yes gene_type:complete
MKLLAVTGSRADWGLLLPVFRRLCDDPRFDAILTITGQHLEPGPQASLAAIVRAGFDTSHSVDIGLGSDDGAVALSAAMGRATAGVGALIGQTAPDMILVLGDRYEILGAVNAALICNVPVAHLCGGDVTEGAMDDAIRHAITKLSALHFVTTDVAAARVAQMGENPDHIYTVGSTGLDHIREVAPMTPADLWADLGLAPADQSFLVTFHPPTLSQDVPEQCDALIAALRAFPQAALIVTGSNADPGARTIDEKMQEFVASRPNAVFRTSLGSQRYFAALGAVDVVIGNSSSGLYEAPSFDVPTVNIGDRQARRVRATSVLDCGSDTGSIIAAMTQALAGDYSGTVNPYGDGHAAARIIDVLAAVKDPRALIRKSFVDIA